MLTAQSTKPAASASASSSASNQIPGSVAAVAAVALPQRLPGPELPRDITPGQAAPEPIDDPLDHPPVVPERPTRPAQRGRQQRCDPSPLRISQYGCTRHRRIIPLPKITYWETLPSCVVESHSRFDAEPDVWPDSRFVVILRHRRQGAPRAGPGPVPWRSALQAARVTHSRGGKVPTVTHW